MMKNIVEYLQWREVGCKRASKQKRGRMQEEVFEDHSAKPYTNKSFDLTGEARSTFLMDFSPNGSLVASTHGDHTVRVSRISTGKCTHVLKGHPRTPWCLAFHPSSSDILASGCLGGEVRIWDLHGGGSEVWQSNTSEVIASMTFHPTDHVLIFAAYNKLYFWDWSRPDPFAVCKTANEFERIRWVKFDPLGHYLYTGIANGSTIQREEPADITSSEWMDPPYNVPDHNSNSQRYDEVLQRYQAYRQDRVRNLMLGRGAQGNRNEGTSESIPSSMEQDIPDVELVRPQSPVDEDNLNYARQYAISISDESSTTSLPTYGHLVSPSHARRMPAPPSLNTQRNSDQFYIRTNSDQLLRDELSAPRTNHEHSYFSRPVSHNPRMLVSSSVGSSTGLGFQTRWQAPSSTTMSGTGGARVSSTSGGTPVSEHHDCPIGVGTILRTRLTSRGIGTDREPPTSSGSSHFNRPESHFRPIPPIPCLPSLRHGVSGSSNIDSLSSFHCVVCGSNHFQYSEPISMTHRRNPAIPQRTRNVYLREPSAVNRSHLPYQTSNSWNSSLITDSHRAPRAMSSVTTTTTGSVTDSTSQTLVTGQSTLHCDQSTEVNTSALSTNPKPQVAPSTNSVTSDNSMAASDSHPVSSATLTSDASSLYRGDAATASVVASITSRLEHEIRERFSGILRHRLQALWDDRQTGDTGPPRRRVNVSSPYRRGGEQSVEDSDISVDSRDPRVPAITITRSPDPTANEQAPNSILEPGGLEPGARGPYLPRRLSERMEEHFHWRRRNITRPPSTMRESGRSWHSMQRRHLHAHYTTPILDETVNVPDDMLQDAINRAIAGAFMGNGETAVATNIINLTHRIQRWDFRHCEIPVIAQSNVNIVIPHCKLHNDASCDLSQDGTLLATFVPCNRGFPDDTVLAVYSLKPDSFARCLYTKRFGPNAISVSISPGNYHVMTGLASKRLSWVFNTSQMVAQVYKLVQVNAGEESMKHVKDIMHPMNADNGTRMLLSVNSARWLPGVGQGLVYGTNRGNLHICQPGGDIYADLDTNGNESSVTTRRATRSPPRQRTLTNMLEFSPARTTNIPPHTHAVAGVVHVTGPRTISTSTQTTSRHVHRTAGTQTSNTEEQAGS